VTLTSKSNQARNQAMRLLQDKIDEKLNTINREKISFKDSADSWKTVYKETVKPSTYARMLQNYQILERYIEKNVLIKNISTPFIQNILEDLYYNKNYSYSVIKSIKSMLNNIFEFALAREHI